MYNENLKCINENGFPVELCVALVKFCCKKLSIDEAVCGSNNVTDTVVHVFNKAIDSVEMTLVRWFYDIAKGEDYIIQALNKCDFKGGEFHDKKANEKAS